MIIFQNVQRSDIRKFETFSTHKVKVPMLEYNTRYVFKSEPHLLFWYLNVNIWTFNKNILSSKSENVHWAKKKWSECGFGL